MYWQTVYKEGNTTHTLSWRGAALPKALQHTHTPADFQAAHLQASLAPQGSSTVVRGSFLWFCGCCKCWVSQDSQKATRPGARARAQLGWPREFYQLTKHSQDQSYTSTNLPHLRHYCEIRPTRMAVCLSRSYSKFIAQLKTEILSHLQLIKPRLYSNTFSVSDDPQIIGFPVLTQRQSADEKHRLSSQGHYSKTLRYD